MNIVIITGSARAHSNTTTMAEAFEAAAYIKAVGTGTPINIKKIDSTALNIGPCGGCATCYSTGKPCSYDDDFNTIAGDIEVADVIVFAAPVYWWTFPAKIKAVIDKFFAMYVGIENRFSGKKVALLSCCEDTDPHTFDGMKFAFEKSMELLHAEVFGEVLITGCLDEGDIKKTDGIDQSAALVNRLF